jgi:DNA-directed RNA polymerase subunit alpha
MEQTVQQALAQIVAKETWTSEDQKAILKLMLSDRTGQERLRQALVEMEAAEEQPRGAAALKIGIARYLLCRFQEAAAALAEATDNKDRHYFAGLCWKQLRRFDKAAEELERARSAGFEALAIDVELIEAQALGGELDAAAKSLAKAQNRLGQSADFFFLSGLIEELRGRYSEAGDLYEKARSVDPGHTAATFRLAYCQDLHGEEATAIELYTECVSRPPVYANALLNLAVLHEDAGRYESARACLVRLLATNPGHLRARLFLKDVEASETMYFDEEQAKRMAKRNAVLDIPVTDFELSVRARNCLKKMNIRTLGDLVKTTEPQLLAYKNFGETSLKEIKDMLTAKNLRLGQANEEMMIAELPSPAQSPQAQSAPQDEGVLATPVEQLDFSVRARKALETLKIRTLGDLAALSEAELLACRNFGQTSLNEVRQRLSEHGLSLREQS